MSTTVSAIGHAKHTREAQVQDGLPGRVSRPIKITMLGAGSNFTPRLVNDVLRIPTADRGTIALVDVDADRLNTMEKLVRKMIDDRGRSGWSLVASTDRMEVMADSDYIVCCVEVSGVQCVEYDNDIPLKYGIDQCIGDTIGPGGVFKALRTVPVFLDILRDAERLCPRAIVLNYTNPMSIMCLAAGRSSRMSVVGLCHSVQGTSQLLADRAETPLDEITWQCAGINHLAWFTQFEHLGRDLYPVLMEKARQDLAGSPSNPDDVWDLVRKDMMLQFGAFITESSGHLSEYLPYYRRSAQVRQRYCGEDFEGGSRFYASNWPAWRKIFDKERLEMLAGTRESDWTRSWEYASWIIEAREKDTPFRIHGNVMNCDVSSRGEAGKLITNLPGDGCVEVACMVDRSGVHPTRYGALPAPMANLCASNMAVFDLAATACTGQSKEAAIHALMMDPLTSAICTPQQIREMAEEMFKAEKQYLQRYE